MQVHQEHRALNVTHTNVSLRLCNSHTQIYNLQKSSGGCSVLWYNKSLDVNWVADETSLTKWNSKDFKVQSRGLQPTRIAPKSRPRAESGTSQMVCPAHVQTRPWPNNDFFFFLAFCLIPLPLDRHGLLHQVSSFLIHFTLVQFVLAWMTNYNSPAHAWDKRSLGLCPWRLFDPGVVHTKATWKKKGKEIECGTQHENTQNIKQNVTPTQNHTQVRKHNTRSKNSAQEQQCGTHSYMEKRFCFFLSFLLLLLIITTLFCLPQTFPPPTPPSDAARLTIHLEHIIS